MVATRDLVLASGSPRRRRLLESAGFGFRSIVPETAEIPIDGETPEEMVTRLAEDKARAVAAKVATNAIVLGADTTVVMDDEAIGKPNGPEEAVEMILRLQGRPHRVLSGYALLTDGAVVERGIVESTVTMRPIARAEAETYVATGEPLDKAGAYAIQGAAGGDLVADLDGSFTNVMGLPMEVIAPLLVGWGAARRR
jgi:septum formation protein